MTPKQVPPVADLAGGTNQNSTGHEQNEEDVIVPSHVAKI